MNIKQSTGLPAFDQKADHKLANLMVCALLMPLMYAVLDNYMMSWVKYLWVGLAAMVTVLLYALGRYLQVWWAKRIGFEKKSDFDKTLWQHIEWKKSVVPFGMALAVGAGMFCLAYGIRQWHYAVTEHETIAHAKGYVYEALAGGYGFFVTYGSALIWFLPDERVFPFDALTLRYGAPVAMLVIPTVLFGVSLWIALFYVVIYFVLAHIRGYRIKQYERLVKRLEREAEEAAHRPRY